MMSLAEYIAKEINEAIKPTLELLDIHTEFANFDEIVNTAIKSYETDFSVRVNVE